MRPMAASTAAPTTARFSGRTLNLARIAGGIIVSFSLFLFVLALPAHITHLQSIYLAEQLAQLRLPPPFFAWYVLPFDIAFELIFALIAVVIFWRRSHDPMALFVSVTLILFAVTFPSAVGSSPRPTRANLRPTSRTMRPMPSAARWQRIPPTGGARRASLRPLCGSEIKMAYIWVHQGDETYYRAIQEKILVWEYRAPKTNPPT
jgi:hypothetical protein